MRGYMKMDKSKLNKLGQDSGSAIARWSLRRKLALALAVPLILAAVLGGSRVVSALSESGNASTSADQVTILAPAVDYSRAAQTAMIAANASGAAAKGDLADAIDDINAAADDLESVSESADLTEAQQTQVATLLELSQELRTPEASTVAGDTWIAQLRQVQSSVTQLITLIINEQNEPEPRLEQLSQALSGRLALSMQQSLVASGDAGRALNQDLFSELGVEAAAIDRLATSLGKEEGTIPTLRSANVDRLRAVREGDKDLGGRDAFVPYDELINKLIKGTTDALADKASSARNSALFSALMTAVALALAVFIALAVAKLLLDPIQRVREGARRVAHETLPEAVARIRSGQEPEPMVPIDVHTEEEIGQLARAVDDLHAQAIHLASGEAQLRATVGEMFVTLSRRSNSLINQQLTLIERLEHDEEDPKRLESLFRLDHLASRMRRTADSLLILADAPGASTGGQGLSVSDAIQAASAGVQDYHRLQVSSHLSTLISDAAAGDVVHLVTEIIDNALAYSSPNDAVRVDTSIDSSGAVVQIADAGIGIPEDERASLNRMLREGGEATPETARRMGLFVVSRLAKRHNIAVQLLRGEFGGTIARIVLPATILPELPQPAEPVVHSYETDEAPLASSPALYEELAEVEATETTAGGLPKRGSRRHSRKDTPEQPARGSKLPLEEAPAVAAEALVEEPTVEVAPVAPTPPAASPAPSLAGDGLLPRRQPGAQMPLTSPDALIPATPASTEGGSLFGRSSTPPPAEPEAPAARAAEPELRPDDTGEFEQVAQVVPISALAGVRAEAAEKAEAEARARGSIANAFTAAPKKASQDLEASTAPEPTIEQAPEPTPESVVEAPLATPPPESPLRPSAPLTQSTALDDPAPAAPSLGGLGGGLPQRTRGAAPQINRDMPGLPSTPRSGRREEESPIFSSMRSGWLSSDGSTQQFADDQVDQGWARAESATEKLEPLSSTEHGLPVRQPGQRLVPGSIAKPTTVGPRDPEAIKAKLSSAAAGISRGRKAVQSSTQHTEAGPS
ncbi:MAG: ATP-binding protein [Nocardioides sp.]|uniref:ATP-binding protein n=1 Tax=Nocardioides sp. TaxID=35761 RepID=UPI003EFF710C